MIHREKAAYAHAVQIGEDECSAVSVHLEEMNMLSQSSWRKERTPDGEWQSDDSSQERTMGRRIQS